MSDSRYKKPLISFLIYCGIIIGLGIIGIIATSGSGVLEEFSPLIPFDNIAIEIVMLLVVIIPIVSLLSALIFGFLLSPFFAWLHYVMKKKNNVFGIDKRPDSKKVQVTKGLFPAILAINFSLMLCTNENIIKVVLAEHFWIGGITSDIYIAAFSVLVGYMIGIGYMIFTPIWFILDAGIVYSNVKDESTSYQPVEARTMGGWYQIIFKGYAGIGTFFSFYSFILGLLNDSNPSDLGAFIGIILIIGLPIFAMLACLPTIILLDVIRNKRNKFVRAFARKIGIKEEVMIKFEIDQNNLIR
jgi:hypothetical protein